MKSVQIPDHTTREKWTTIVHEMQDQICNAIEMADGKERFLEDLWIREEGGSGKTRIISNGNVIEKGGVNTSTVYGEVTPAMRKQLNIDGEHWFAAGLSVVLHPSNPFVPTIHCNYRMFELYDQNYLLKDRWFGGGSDLTPYYLFEEDAVHFHGVYKNTCDRFDPSFHSIFKKDCDNYFVNWHRNEERRGIGGIFYDYRRPVEHSAGEHSAGEHSVDDWMGFGKACGAAFLSAYLPIVEKRKDTGFTGDQKKWQELRRGRYVEFNLVHDRGTLFGLKTNGRIESILMSLPPSVRFEYNHQPEPGSEEDKLLQVCLNPRDWV